MRKCTYTHEKKQTYTRNIEANIFVQCQGTYSRVVSRQTYLHVNIHICLYALATLRVIRNVDCVSWDHATAGGMATIDPVVLACNKPLLMKALCINFPVHDKMFASSLVRRNINASCSFPGLGDIGMIHATLRFAFHRDRLGMLSKNGVHLLWFCRGDTLCYW